MPFNRTTAALRSFQNRLKENRSGWAHHTPEELFESDDSGWEFRISLSSDPENLRKAAEALGPVFAKEGLKFKFILRDGDFQAINWDPNKSKLGDTSDQHESGTECRVAVRFNTATKQFEKSPEELKALMLKAWRALQENNIQYGYTSAPNGHKAITVSGGLVSPFSCVAYRPQKGRHGHLIPSIYQAEVEAILKGETTAYAGELKLDKSTPNPKDTFENIGYDESSVHNPLFFDDPFHDITFTPEDLLKSKIEIGEVLQAQYQRTEYLKNHIDNAQEQLENYFSKKPSSQGQYEDSIVNKLNSLYKDFLKEDNKGDFLKRKLREIKEICKQYPRDVFTSELYKLEQVEELEGLIQNLRDNPDAKTIDEISNLLKEICGSSAQKECDAIKADFATYLSKDATFNVYQSCYERMAFEEPANAQLLFRQMIHLRNERQAYTAELERMKQHEVLIPIHESIAMLDITNKAQAKLRQELIKLQGELCLKLQQQDLQSSSDENVEEGLIDTSAEENVKDSLIDTSANDIATIANSIKTMTMGILSDSEKKAKVKCVETFEEEARALPSLQKTTWNKVGKAVACVLLAAVGVALGVVVGAVVVGTILAIMSTPAGGVAGVLGVAYGVLQGNITGWAVGIMASSVFGLAAGAASGLHFIGKDRVDRVKEAADNVAFTQAPKPSK